MTTCNTEQLILYWSGECTAEENSAVKQHLATCAACREYLEHLQTLQRDAALIPMPRPTRDLVTPAMKRAKAKPRGEMIYLKPLAMAAALLILLGLGFLFRPGESNQIARVEPAPIERPAERLSFETHLVKTDRPALRKNRSFSLAKSSKTSTRRFKGTDKSNIKRIRNRMNRLKQRIDSGPVVQGMLDRNLRRSYS